jgi:hypothetical protein
MYASDDLFDFTTDWEIRLTFKGKEGKTYELQFNSGLPPPLGFKNKINDPFLLSFMVLQRKN